MTEMNHTLERSRLSIAVWTLPCLREFVKEAFVVSDAICEQEPINIIMPLSSTCVKVLFTKEKFISTYKVDCNIQFNGC
jgi:hypothetical protein